GRHRPIPIDTVVPFDPIAGIVDVAIHTPKLEMELETRVFVSGVVADFATEAAAAGAAGAAFLTCCSVEKKKWDIRARKTIRVLVGLSVPSIPRHRRHASYIHGYHG